MFDSLSASEKIAREAAERAPCPVIVFRRPEKPPEAA